MPMTGDNVPGSAFGVQGRLALRTAGAKPREKQKCKYCDSDAEKSILFSDRREHIAVCPAHDRMARNEIVSGGKGVDDVVEIDQSLPGYREDGDPILAMAKDTRIPENSYFGARVNGTPGVAQSVMGEAPMAFSAKPPRVGTPNKTRSPRLPIKLQRIKGDDGKVTKYRAPQAPSGTLGIGPQTVLKMLGTDWKMLRMTRIHDNRMTIKIDGQRYTIYTRRG